MINYTATWQNQVVATANLQEVINIEGNVYFPKASVSQQFLMQTNTTYTCPWKGDCTYYNVTVNGQVNPDAAWSYNAPKDSAIAIVGKDFSGYVAFWKGIVVSQQPAS
jgi:uncharacterized protein (DUF427 family)